MEKLKESQLIINPDGSIYHLNLKPGQIADTILLVGDPGRVNIISRRFDSIEFKTANREMITHTGYFQGKHLSVISTGIGPDNIDIVLNELDALVNVDFEKRVRKENLNSLRLVRLGTSGSIQPDIPINAFGLSTHGLGMDGLFYYYGIEPDLMDRELTASFVRHSHWPDDLPKPYIVEGNAELREKLGKGMFQGITATAPGFYAPQGRAIRLPLHYPDLIDRIASFRKDPLRIINFEMETSALYFLAKALGHRAVTVCSILANRPKEIYTSNPAKPIDELIDLVLERI